MVHLISSCWVYWLIIETIDKKISIVSGAELSRGPVGFGSGSQPVNAFVPTLHKWQKIAANFFSPESRYI